MISKQNNQRQNWVQAKSRYIEGLVRKGGPEPEEFTDLCNWYKSVMTKHYQGELEWVEIQQLWSAFGEAFSPKTLQGWVVNKPLGYHGDYQLIDNIYCRKVTSESHLAKWDKWFHRLKAVEAVRNRKDYFHSLLQGLHRREPRVLNVGSGSGRDVAEYQAKFPDHGIRFTCLDLDPRAHSYAQMANGPIHEAEFLAGDLFRYSDERSYDLAWSAGVFDYLDDRRFVLAIRKLLPNVRPGGSLVVGNFSPDNPTRLIMEFGGWQLFHRSASELLRLAEKSGIPSTRVSVGKEPNGVNLFLKIHAGDPT